MACGCDYERKGRKVMDKLIQNEQAFKYIKERAHELDISVVEYCGKYSSIVYEKMKEFNND